MGPSFKGIELGIGDSIILKAVAEATGRTLAAIKASYDELGDLGQVAEQSRGTQRTMFRPPPLTIRGVFKVLLEIAQESGHSSQNKKKSRIQGLIVACRDCEARYIVKSLTGKLRIGTFLVVMLGLAEKSMIVALAHAVTYTPSAEILDASQGQSTTRFHERLEKNAEILKMVHSELPNYDVIAPTLLEHGIDQVTNLPSKAKLHSHCHLTPGVPVYPMLAQPTKGVREVLKRFENMEFTTEFKYDGERAQVRHDPNPQVHRLSDGTVNIYSRNHENNTGKYPDIIKRLTSALSEGTTDFIIDSECVAYDIGMPCRLLMHRKQTYPTFSAAIDKGTKKCGG